jgi:putative peptidoglycan lipid II flippase
MFKSFFTVSFFIFLSRIAGFVRDLFIANYLGVSILSDVFFAAFRLPNFFRRIFAEGAFNSAFVPIFIAKNQNDKSEQIIFLKNIFSILFYFLLVFTLLIQIFMPFVMKSLFPGFFSDQNKFSLLVDLSRITIFYLIFISLVSLCSAVLNSVNKFAVAAASPIILNITLIFSIFIFAKFSPTIAHALSYGVFLAGILQFLFLFFFTYKAGFLIYPKIPSFNSDIKKFFKKLLPGIIGANVLQINLLIDSIFASAIASAMSYLYYADRINQLPLAMIGIAIGIAILPNLSKKISAAQFSEAIKLQNKAVEICLILVIPATLALTILSYPIISALFERGQFGSDQSYNVSRALMFYSFGLPAYAIVKVIEPAFFARGDTKTVMKIAIFSLISNVIWNMIFYHLQFSYIGIVLASVISSYLNLSCLLIILMRKKHFIFADHFTKRLAFILFAAISMAIALFLTREFFAINDFNKIIELAIMIFIGLVVYVLVSYFCGNLDVILKSNIFKKVTVNAKNN